MIIEGHDNLPSIASSDAKVTKTWFLSSEEAQRLRKTNIVSFFLLEKGKT